MYGFYILQSLVECLFANAEPQDCTESFRTSTVVLFCFRIDVDKDIVSPCDREIIINIIGLVKHTPGSSMLFEILSSTEVPKPSEIKSWKQRNEIAAVELEQLVESYMKSVMIKIKM